MKKDSPDPPDINGQPSTDSNSNTCRLGAHEPAKSRPGRLQSPALAALRTDASPPSNIDTTTDRHPVSPTPTVSPTAETGEKHKFERTVTSPVPGSHAARQIDGISTAPAHNSHHATHAACSVAPVLSPPDEGLEPDLDSKEIDLEAFALQDTNDTLASQEKDKPKSPNGNRAILQEVYRSFRLVATHSWLNLLLIFVPVGIIVANIPHLNGGIVFSMNCIAVIPLAGLLSHATESVASNMGDALGALLNITFGNAVELIIFIIALAKNEIRIVQASLLGSILANLLLILGMGFFLGGLRYREQVYNSTVTQMSACLLSLSVISLVLPTAFHASFKDDNLANRRSLKISRGTSVILLIVYVLYLLFQLKSHAYMYESTPQHIVDAEAIPGPAAGWLNSSSSEDGSSSSSDSDDSRHSRDTVRRKMRKVLRSRRRGKSSATSQDGYEKDRRSSSFGASNASPPEAHSEASSSKPSFFLPGMSTANRSEDAVQEDAESNSHGKHRRKGHKNRSKKRPRLSSRRRSSRSDGPSPGAVPDVPRNDDNDTKRVDFAIPTQRPKSLGAAAPTIAELDPRSAPEEAVTAEQGTPKRPAFHHALRTISVRNFAPTVFTQKSVCPEMFPAPVTGPVPRIRYGIRRTNSLPDRLSGQHQHVRAPGGFFPAQVPSNSFRTGTVPKAGDADADDDGHLTRWAAIILLLLTTGLVAVCAEFLVDSIREVTSQSSSVGEIFIGLIILPIVGNAAEHVTAITVAMKNKMDLAIGVAVGSSIQIALFVTPLIVILGWIMDRQMTLYFTLFETVCLFVSTFIVNFLVLDGRSNYLEGALLCAVYVIIAVVAFFYPSPEEASNWGS